MPETGASGSVGAPLEESGALPGNVGLNKKKWLVLIRPLTILEFWLLRRLPIALAKLRNAHLCLESLYFRP